MMISSRIDPLSEQQIAVYLSQNPDYFDRHPVTLTALTLQHESGAATSLVERQLHQLREQNHDYRTQLDELLQVARANSLIDQRLHQVTLALIGTQSVDDLLETLRIQLQSLLEADAVAIKLFASADLQSPTALPEITRLQPFFQHRQPCCGTLSEAQADYLFGVSVKPIRSVVLIPLQSDALTGIVAMGSGDAARFDAAQGVDFLQRLTDVVNAILNRKAG